MSQEANLVVWNWDDHRIVLDVTMPAGIEADVILPDKSEHVSAGHYHFEAACHRMDRERTGRDLDEGF